MKNLGPGLVVTAAFIGPGTVTTASVAGANFGFALAWALVFSVLATFVLQEMASRLGITTGAGLAEALRQTVPQGTIRVLSLGLVIAAIGIGNAAYQAGNLTGAALGLSSVLPLALEWWVVLLAAVAGALLYSGKHKLLEGALGAMVALMSLVFIVSMIIVPPDWSALFSGLLVPRMPDSATLTVIALIGTTVVPYNLFLHAALVAQGRQENQPVQDALRENRRNAGLAIGLGGLITLAIMSCAATAFFASGQAMDSGNIASQLQPLLGDFASYFFALGLFAAGLTSAITAPLAAAYAVCGALGWSVSMQATRFRAVWLVVLLCGAGFACAGIKPLLAIQFAQAANGLLLPLIALFLIWVMNQTSLLGQYRNGALANVLGGMVVTLVSLLGLYKLTSLFVSLAW